MRRILIIGALALCLSGCDYKKPPKPQGSGIDPVEQRREEEFARKERCAVAADRLDKHFKDGLSEVFYSSKRNSCVCEYVSTEKGSSYHELFDCLTREPLGIQMFQLAAPNLQQQLEAWKDKKAALR
jgi:hypothetical protein